MLSRQAKKFVVAEVREIEADRAVILVAINKDEYFFSVVPLQFCPPSSRGIHQVFFMSWEFISVLDRSNARVIGHDITGSGANPAMTEAMAALIEVKHRLGLVT